VSRFLLDTNIISHLIKGHPAVLHHVTTTPMSALFISAITEGELAFGLAKRPQAKKLHLAVSELLKRVDVLPWDSPAAAQYGSLRAMLEARGQILGSLDMRIAAHALSAGCVLVSNDQAFSMVPGLDVADWTTTNDRS
jgi:tRNA(fMet)-specific endonuclease VapC